MARYDASFNFSANLEIFKNAPLDTRIVVPTIAELTKPETWADKEGKVWLYNGIVVSVTEAGKYGLYMLQNFDPTTAADAYKTATNWVLIDASAIKDVIEGGLVQSVGATTNKGIEIGGNSTNPTVGIKIDNTTPGNVTLETGANGLKGSVTIPEAPVKSVAAATGENAVVVTPTTGDVKISLKTDNTGNVQFSQTTANGLKGQVTIPVTDIAEGEKILDLTSTKLGTTLKLSYADLKIKLLGKNDVEVTSVDLPSSLFQDQYLKNVTWDSTGNKLQFTFNVADGTAITDVDLSKFIDRYEEGQGIKFTEAASGGVNKIEVELDSTTEKYLKVSASGLKLEGVDSAISTAVSGVNGGNVALTGYNKGTSTEDVKATDKVNEAIAKLENRVEQVKSTAEAAASKAVVTSFGGKDGAITVETTGTANGDIAFTIGDDKKLTGHVKGISGAAYKAEDYYATAEALEAVKGKSDTALQSISKGTDGAYVTTTVSAKGSGTTLNVSVALTYGDFTSTNGVAKTEDVKTFVNSLLEWQEVE